MSAHGLYCTVCKETFESRESWILHLLTESHQSSARQACIRWGKKERKCTIVVFSDKPVAEVGSLLEYFSLKDLSTIATDFVWWPDRPRMGLMQFESRRKVKEVLWRLEKPVLQLPDCFVYFKEATAYLDCEWGELVCIGAMTDFPKETQNIQIEDKKPKLLNYADISTNDIDLDEGDRTVKKEINSSGEGCDPVSRNLSPIDASQETSVWSLRVSEFNNLSKLLIITDREQQKYSTIINHIENILGAQHEVNMYRNGILGLRNPGNNNILLLHVIRKKNVQEEDPCYTKDDLKLEQTLLNFKSTSKDRNLPRFKRVNINELFEMKLGGMTFVERNTRKRFTVTCDSMRNVEVQMGKLLEYFCTFDPCIQSLFSLIYFWAKTNQVHLEEKYADGNLSHSNLPDPAALDWLVILFLSREGILPTTGEIMASSFDDPYDITFEADPKLVEEWRIKNKQQQRLSQNPQETEFILKTLRLLKGFFKLLDQLCSDKRCLVINARNAEILAKDELFSNPIQCETKLSSKEIAMLQKYVMASKSRIYMINPLFVTWKLSLCNESIEKYADIVNETATRMKKFVKEYFKTEFLHEKLDLMEAIIGPHGMIKRKEYLARKEEEFKKRKMKIAKEKEKLKNYRRERKRLLTA